MPISRWRVIARSSIRLATLAIAIKSTQHDRAEQHEQLLAEVLASSSCIAGQERAGLAELLGVALAEAVADRHCRSAGPARS
jgi:hypothetical protein